MEGANALGEAEGVEEFNPPTAEPGAAASRNWADLSEDISSPVPSCGEAPTSADRPEGHLTDVKEELHQETSSPGAVPSTFFLPDGVADENVATDFANQVSDPATAFYRLRSSGGRRSEPSCSSVDSIRASPS